MLVLPLPDVCVCVCAGTCVHMYTCMWKPRVSFLWNHLPCLFETGSLTDLDSQKRLCWLALEPQDLFVLSLLSTGISSMHHQV